VNPPAAGSNVYVSRRVPETVEHELRASFDLEIHDSLTPPSRERLLDKIGGRDGVVTMLTDRVDEEFLDAAGSDLRVVANYAVGYNNIDVASATQRGVLVTNTPDVLRDATAELTVAMILSAARRIDEGDRLVRRREPWIWAPTFMLGRDLRDATLGIVGLGSIGTRVAELASAFGLHVIHSSRSRFDPRYERVSLGRLLTVSDVISLHCPLTPDTHHLIGVQELRLLKPQAILVNTGRGPLVDEVALAEALAENRIGAAALDVYEHEPHVTERLLDLENVLLVPHLGSATEATRLAMGALCVSALRQVLVDRAVPANAVNPEAVAL
jgi:glyoxylate reductase